MDEGVAVWYRGTRYELGRGPGFFGLWDAGGSWLPPLERWPESPEGWSAAWARFTMAEVPGSIVHLSEGSGQPATTPAQATTWYAEATTPSVQAAQATSSPAQPTAPAAAGAPAADAAHSDRAIGGGIMVLAGVGSGLAALFPAYLGVTSLASQAFELVPHLIYLAAWAVSAVLILFGGTRRQVGALLGAGTGVVAFGLFLADLGTAVSATPRILGPGLLLSLFGWLVCTAGSALAFRPSLAGAPAWRHGDRRGAVPLLTVAALGGAGAAAFFAPAWDSFTLRTPAGAAQTITAGYAFANPGLVVAGDVLVMAALVIVAVTAALWRPGRLGAALLAGAAIPLAAQAISAVVQITEPVSPAQFGISPSQAAQAGLTISSGLTSPFWIYCAFVGVLIATAGWMLLLPRAGRQPRPSGYPVPAAAAGPFGAATPPLAAADGPVWTPTNSAGPGSAPPPSA